MQKNVASQKLIVFAFDSTTNSPKTGDAANLTAYVSKDFGAVTVLGDTTATEMDSTNAKGYYLFDLTQSETNADTLLFSAKSSTANIVVIGCPACVYTVPPNFSLESIDSNGRLDVIKLAGTTCTARDIGASVLLSNGTGTGQVTLTSGRVNADITHISAVAVSTSTAQLGVNVVNAGGTAWGSGAITAGSIAADAITAAKIADNAIDRATFAADTGLQSIRSNTAQAGASTAITLDASASATTDFYKYDLVYLTGGTGVGQYRLITAYNGSSKVATVTPAWATNPASDSTFAVIPRGMADLETILAVAVNTSTAQLGVNVVNFGGSAGTFASGRPEVNTSHFGGTAGTFASGRPEVNTTHIRGTASAGAVGYVGIDWGNVTAQSTSVNLSATTINLVNTATTVTNQLTAAAIATGVWQDSTAGDFTTVSSIGKALYIANIAPGGSGGHMISGSNSGTTTLGALTVTGATTLTGAVTGTNASNDLRVNTTLLGGSATPITNMGIVFNTDFAANYNTTTDTWNVNLTHTAGGATTGSAGYVGIDWGQIANQGATIDLSDTSISLATNVSSVNGINTNVITAASIAADAGTEIGTAVWATTTRQLTGTQSFNLTGNITGNLSGSVGSVTAAVTVTGDCATAGTRLLTMIELDGSVYRYTTNALEQAPSGSGSSPATIAAAVWDEAISGHLTSGTTGAALNAAGSAGDPWTTTLPGSYTGTQAGFIFGTLRATTLDVRSPVVAETEIELVIGDDYYAADNDNLQFTIGASPSLSGATVTFQIQTDTSLPFTDLGADTNASSTSATVSGTNPQLVLVDIPYTLTQSMTEGWRAFRIKAVLSNGHIKTLRRGRVNLLSRGNDAP